MQRVNWNHLFLQDRLESSCESASRNLSFPVSFPKAAFNIISDTGREFYFIFASDVLKRSDANTCIAANMARKGVENIWDLSWRLFRKEIYLILHDFQHNCFMKRWLILHDFQTSLFYAPL